jgi:hypothetical protein
MITKEEEDDDEEEEKQRERDEECGGGRRRKEDGVGRVIKRFSCLILFQCVDEIGNSWCLNLLG